MMMMMMMMMTMTMTMMTMMMMEHDLNQDTEEDTWDAKNGLLLLFLHLLLLLLLTGGFGAEALSKEKPGSKKTTKRHQQHRCVPDD